jgi:pimeloyl-ACP methyl ester carboxylesterase
VISMETNDVSVHKRALAVFLAVLMVLTAFWIVGRAVDTPLDTANAEYAKHAIVAHPNVTKNNTLVHPNETSASGRQSTALRTTLRLEQTSMVSPNELGIGVSVTYPVFVHADVPRYITITAAINGKPVEKTFNVTQYTTPGVRWGGALGSENEMFDAKDTLKPTTPLRINLEEEGVPRFTDNANFTLTGVAFAGDGARSDPSSTKVTIPLPVVILMGMPSVLPPWLPDLYSLVGYYFVGYSSLTDFMLKAGDGTFKYNNKTEWDVYEKELQARGYSTHQYVTLWDPYAEWPNHPVIRYKSPQEATPDDLKADVDRIMSEHVWPYSYASKCNLVGYSFGGLVGRYYASVAPQNVNTVIAVGAPYEGDTNFYKAIFNYNDSLVLLYRLLDPRILRLNDIPEIQKLVFGLELHSREEVERWMSVPSYMSSAGKPSVMWWCVPTYDCLVTPDYLPINPYFTNTYNAPPVSGVKYYSIYVDGVPALKTDEKVTINYVKDQNWYNITHITQGYGDGEVLAKSAASFGEQYPTQVTNQPVSVLCWHPYLLFNPEIQALIYQDLRR